MVQDDETMTFDKLAGSVNYKQWARNMEIAIKISQLWTFVEGTQLRPPPLVSKPEDDEERREKVYTRAEQIQEVKSNERRAVYTIIDMCTEEIQIELFASKPEDGWTAKYLWYHLKTQYTQSGWSTKWKAVVRLLEYDYDKVKSIEKYGFKALDIESELLDLRLTVREVNCILMMNGLGPKFDDFVSILSNEVRNNETVPDTKSMIRRLRQEEQRLLNIEQWRRTASAR
ncbi:hypothetical protein MMC12_001406 [Toensbergia leucococca]|nr:hypothetical protein [Toensbergia leucococca]